MKTNIRFCRITILYFLLLTIGNTPVFAQSDKRDTTNEKDETYGIGGRKETIHYSIVATEITNIRIFDPQKQLREFYITSVTADNRKHEEIRYLNPDGFTNREKISGYSSSGTQIYFEEERYEKLDPNQKIYAHKIIFGWKWEIDNFGKKHIFSYNTKTLKYEESKQ
jgi:hypothetical protein